MPLVNGLVPPDYENWLEFDKVYAECCENLSVVDDVARALVSEPVRKLGNKLDHQKLRPMIEQLARDAEKQRKSLDAIYARRPLDITAQRDEFESFDLSMNIGQAIMAWSDHTDNCVVSVVTDILEMINQHLTDADRIEINLKEINLG